MSRIVTILLLIALFSLAATAPQANAETVYIRDTLYVPLRGGQSTEHRILHRGLKSGTRLERLEINDDTGYSRVRTELGLEGWLQSQYLVEAPIAVQQLDGITEELEDLEAQHQQTLLRIRDLTEANESMAAELASLTSDKEQLSKELQEITALAADTINIDEENVRLNSEQAELANEINDLILANQTLQNDDSQQWFLRGAGTVLIGLLFGFWIGRRIYNRRNTGGWG